MAKNLALQLTMLRVKNYGSVLQAYALNRYISSLPNWVCKAIDLSPNVPGVLVSETSFMRSVREAISALLVFIHKRGRSIGFRKVLGPLRHWYENRFLMKRYAKNFDQFVACEIDKTEHFKDEDQLRSSSIRANAFIIGSDQTFNPRFTNGNPVWFLDFVRVGANDRIRKITYASSVASACMTEGWQKKYNEGWKNFDALSFREKSGVELARYLGLDAFHCCDPTLLLTREDWVHFASCGKSRAVKPYLLVYNLRYMLDPYPLSQTIEMKISSELKLHVVYLNCPIVYRPCQPSQHIWKCTPHEFVKLFMEAAFIITDSFHGTAFSLLSRKPFVSIVANEKSADSRVVDLLERCKAASHVIPSSERQFSEVDVNRFASTEREQKALEEFRESSCGWLRKQLEFCE